jgi:hypothetical protein
MIATRAYRNGRFRQLIIGGPVEGMRRCSPPREYNGIEYAALPVFCDYMSKAAERRHLEEH